MADETSTAEAEPDARNRDAAPWLALITDATKCMQKYQDKCDNIDKLYADLDALAKDTADREFQIFWANLEVLKPSIYSRPPVPVVVPRFKDRKPLPRKASEVLERSLISSFEADDIDATMCLARDDLAINSRGVVWLRYEAKTTGDGKLSEKVCKEHVERDDFLHDPARKWAEVEWVARRSWLNKKKGVKRFGEAFLGAEFKEQDTDKDGNYKGEKKAAVWEIWHKGENIVVWVSPNMDEVLDIQPPFLALEGFFPCPRPAYGTIKRKSLVPVPDLLYYKDQVEEINELTARISSLAESLRLKGFYPSGVSEVGEAIEAVLKDMDNRAVLVGVSNFAAIGGQALKDSIVWLPVDVVATTIAQLVELRRQMIEDVYQITGISDIMRGATEASETLGAQQLKSQYGSIRIRDRQKELVRLARDITRIEAEIMAENFQPQTLLSMSQMDDLPSMAEIQQQIIAVDQKLMQAAQSPQVLQMVQQAPEQAQQMAMQAQQAAEAEKQQLQQTVTIDAVVQLLRDQHIRPFVLEIETDSTIQPDEDAAKQRATEFITAVGGYMAQAIPLATSLPAAAPLAGDMLKFVASQFRVGREIDGTIDEFVDKMKQIAAQPQPPNPEQVKAELEAKRMEAEAQAKAQEAEVAQAEREAEAPIKAAEAQARLDEIEAKKLADAQKAKDDVILGQQKIRQGELAIQQALVNLNIAKADLAAKGMEVSEDGEEMTDKSDRHATAIMEAVTSLKDGLMAMASGQAEANAMLARVLSAPRSVTMPDGRTITATTQVN